MNTISEREPEDMPGVSLLSSFLIMLSPFLFLSNVLGLCLGNVLRHNLLDNVLLGLVQKEELPAELLHRKFVAQFVDGFYKFVLYRYISLVACTAVVLERDNSLRYGIGPEALDLGNFFLGEVGIVAGIGQEFLDFIL